MNVNVLNYVSEVYCPVDPGIFSLAGLVKLQGAVAEVVKFLDNHTLRIAGLVLTRTQRDNISRDVEAEVRATFGRWCARRRCPASTKIGKAHARFMSVLDYAPALTKARRLTRPSYGRSSLMAKSTGLGNTGNMLLRPSTVPDEGPDAAAPPDDGSEESRGELAPESQRTPAKPRANTPFAPTGKTKGRKLYLTDDIHDRLWFMARRRKTNVSVIANESARQSIAPVRTETFRVIHRREACRV